MKEKIIMYTDGGARGNPGPAAVGVVLYQMQGKKEVRWKDMMKYLGTLTNNEAEYKAVIEGLKKAKALLGSERAKNTHIEIRMDSELVARQLSGTYRIEEDRLKILFVDAWNARMDFGEISFKEIPREKNKEADALVNAALDKEGSTLF